jgi:hypothetical protein
VSSLIIQIIFGERNNHVAHPSSAKVPSSARTRPSRWKRGLLGCRKIPPPPQFLMNKTMIFIDAMTSNVLRDLPFGRNEPQKSADVKIRKNKILKNKKIELVI